MKNRQIVRCAFVFSSLLLCWSSDALLFSQTAVPDQSQFKVILTSFSQAWGKSPLLKPKRNYGNCDAIATIKAAMAAYGVDRVLLVPRVLPTSNSGDLYQIQLRDGRSLSLTHAELDTAINDPNLNSGFLLPEGAVGNPQILFKANFLYAVMAKSILNHPEIGLYSDVRSYQAALARLGAGINVTSGNQDQIGLLLGLELKPTSATQMSRSIPYVYALRKHVVFAYGSTGDLDGSEAPLDAILRAHSTGWTRHLRANKNPEVYTIQSGADEHQFIH